LKIIHREAHLGATDLNLILRAFGRPVLVFPLGHIATEGESHRVPVEADVCVGVVNVPTSGIHPGFAKRKVVILLHIQVVL
jgi:hypothetical protein